MLHLCVLRRVFVLIRLDMIGFDAHMESPKILP